MSGIPVTAIEDLAIFTELIPKRGSKFPMTLFSGAIPFCGTFVNVMDCLSRNAKFFEHATISDLRQSLNLSVISQAIGTKNIHGFNLFRACGSKVVGQRTLYAVKVYHTQIVTSDETATCETYDFTVNKSKWSMKKYRGRPVSAWTNNIDGSCARFIADMASISRMVHLFSSIQLTGEYEWHTDFGVANGISIRLPIAPNLIFDLFADRDKSPTMSRRAALIHFVKAHTRKKKCTNDEVAYIRRHLRGCDRFAWQGFDCAVLPAVADLDELVSQ